MTISPSALLGTRNVSNKNCRENQNTHFMFNNFFSRILYRVWDVEKHGAARQTTDDNIMRRMRSACRITKAIAHTLIIYNTFCFSTTTMVTRTRMNVMLYVLCLSRFGKNFRRTPWLAPWIYDWLHVYEVLKRFTQCFNYYLGQISLDTSKNVIRL